MPDCRRCGKKITSADCIGLNQKLVNRGVQEFFCMSCLAGHFNMTEQDLAVMADHFRAAGCSLFPPKETEKK